MKEKSWRLPDLLEWHRSPHGFDFLDGWLLGLTRLLIPKSAEKPHVSHLARAGNWLGCCSLEINNLPFAFRDGVCAEPEGPYP